VTTKVVVSAKPAVVIRAAALVVTSVTFQTLPAPWGCISYRESTNNLSAINPISGTEGAFQFAQSTWTKYAPAGYPSSPLGATLGQQLTVAKAVQVGQGWGAWESASLCGV
jgi:hypothetical protein